MIQSPVSITLSIRNFVRYFSTTLSPALRIPITLARNPLVQKPFCAIRRGMHTEMTRYISQKSAH